MFRLDTAAARSAFRHRRAAWLGLVCALLLAAGCTPQQEAEEETLPPRQRPNVRVYTDGSGRHLRYGTFYPTTLNPSDPVAKGQETAVLQVVSLGLLDSGYERVVSEERADFLLVARVQVEKRWRYVPEGMAPDRFPSPVGRDPGPHAAPATVASPSADRRYRPEFTYRVKVAFVDGAAYRKTGFLQETWWAVGLTTTARDLSNAELVGAIVRAMAGFIPKAAP